MKKILCIFMCILLLGGCGREKAKEVQKEPLEFGGFECIVRSRVNDIEIAAETVYTPFESLIFTFSEPETVKDMQICCKSGEYTFSAGTVTFTVAGDKMPFSMACRALEDCLDRVRGALPEPDGSYAYENNGHIYKLYVDPNTKSFTKLTSDGTDLLTFESFVFSPQQ